MAEFKRRSKKDVVGKQVFTFPNAKTKAGKRQKSGVRLTFKDDDKVTLLNPAGKATKYVAEIKGGKKLTNEGEIKRKDGRAVELDCCARAYRAGYLAAQKDNGKIYNSKIKK